MVGPANTATPEPRTVHSRRGAGSAVGGKGTQAIVEQCTGAADQKWDRVDAKTGKVLPPAARGSAAGADAGAATVAATDTASATDAATASATGSAVQLRQRSSGLVLHVPHCAHATLPYGPGPILDVVNATDPDGVSRKTGNVFRVGSFLDFVS